MSPLTLHSQWVIDNDDWSPLWVTVIHVAVYLYCSTFLGHVVTPLFDGWNVLQVCFLKIYPKNVLNFVFASTVLLILANCSEPPFSKTSSTCPNKTKFSKTHCSLLHLLYPRQDTYYVLVTKWTVVSIHQLFLSGIRCKNLSSNTNVLSRIVYTVTLRLNDICHSFGNGPAFRQTNV